MQINIHFDPPRAPIRNDLRRNEISFLLFITGERLLLPRDHQLSHSSSRQFINRASPKNRNILTRDVCRWGSSFDNFQFILSLAPRVKIFPNHAQIFWRHTKSRVFCCLIDEWWCAINKPFNGISFGWLINRSFGLCSSWQLVRGVMMHYSRSNSPRRPAAELLP